MEKKLVKRVNVSSKRQITIPKEFFDQMQISNNRVRIYLEGKRMIVEPVALEKDIFDFTDQIRTKLEKEGFTGQQLVAKLAEQKNIVENAFGRLIKEAEEEYKFGKTVDHEELFDDMDEEN